MPESVHLSWQSQFLVRGSLELTHQWSKWSQGVFNNWVVRCFFPFPYSRYFKREYIKLINISYYTIQYEYICRRQHLFQHFLLSKLSLHVGKFYSNIRFCTLIASNNQTASITITISVDDDVAYLFYYHYWHRSYNHYY